MFVTNVFSTSFMLNLFIESWLGHSFQWFSPGPVPRLKMSYIDLHVNKQYDKQINSGLGSETLIYLDSDLIVVNKPSFAQTAPGFRENDSLASRIQTLFGIERLDHMVCHRLDYATSGIVVFARNHDALKVLNAQFRERSKVYKRYSAIVSGIMDSYEGEIDLPLKKDGDRGGAPLISCLFLFIFIIISFS